MFINLNYKSRTAITLVIRVNLQKPNLKIMKKTILIITIAAMAFSCSSDKKKSEEGDTAKTSSNSYDCLLKYEDKYDALLTVDEMASVYSFNPQEVEVDVSNRSYGHHTVKWPSDRPDMTLKVAGMDMTLKDENSLSVAVLSYFSKDLKLDEAKNQFDRGYKKLSAQEIDEINKNLEKTPEENREINKDLMDARTKMNYAFVDNLGSSAWYKWNKNYGGELAVLAGRTKFNIRTKISKDSLENLEVSKKLAQVIIEKCN